MHFIKDTIYVIYFFVLKGFVEDFLLPVPSRVVRLLGCLQEMAGDVVGPSTVGLRVAPTRNLRTLRRQARLRRPHPRPNQVPQP